ncbi:MAG: hypothetical protein LQ350_001672 [Teloschistes chrysophthalmus]|nr:MAG: hypothetical protein LQ350_001672 [Niorma chrysophthalma]
MNFAFGIGNYFTFSFNLQLGPGSSLKDWLAQERGRVAQSSAPVEVESAPNSPNSSIQQSSINLSDQQNQNEASSEETLKLCLGMVQNSSGQCPMDDTSDNLALSVSTSAPVHTPTNIGQSLPQTPPSAVHTIPARIQRPGPHTRFRDFYGNLPYSRYLQTRAAGSRIRLPPLKPSTKQLPTPPALDTLSTESGQKPLSLLTIPVEIRTMIYHELLVSAQCIKKPHKLVCNKKSIMLDSLKPVRDIDSAVLRVCRSIYNEALPILYGKNTFEFSKPRKLRDFSHAGLDRRITKFALREAETGRFTLIRSIILRLGHDRKPYVWQHHGTTQAPDRKKIWSHWYQYFFNEGDNRSEYDWSLVPCLSSNFPALDKLELDFTDWQLGAQDAIRVEPFIAKFGRSPGLSCAVIKGVLNRTNLEELRTGLVKPGGTFTVKP